MHQMGAPVRCMPGRAPGAEQALKKCPAVGSASGWAQPQQRIAAQAQDEPSSSAGMRLGPLSEGIIGKKPIWRASRSLLAFRSSASWCEMRTQAVAEMR